MSILQLLKDKYTPETLPYHVVIPSLPGYTLSSGPRLDKDFGIEDVARILDRLMALLGFGGGFVAQGGDVGSRVARYMGAFFESCKGRPNSAQRLQERQNADTVTCLSAVHGTKSPPSYQSQPGHAGELSLLNLFLCLT